MSLTIYDEFLTPRLIVTTNVDIVVGNSDIALSARAGVTGATNIGGDVNGMFINADNNVLNFKNLAELSAVTLTSNQSIITISAAPATTIVSGATNIGGDAGGLFINTVSSILVFKNITQGSYVALTNTDSTLRIAIAPLISFVMMGTAVATVTQTLVLVSTVATFPTSYFSSAPVANFGVVLSKQYVNSYVAGISTTSMNPNIQCKNTNMQNVAPIGNVNGNPSSAITSNKYPIIAFEERIGGVASRLKFARNTMQNGKGVWIISTVDASTSTGKGPSIAVLANGLPAIAYGSYGESKVKFAVNSLPDGSGSWTISTLDTSLFGSADNQLSLAVLFDGSPAIAFTANNALKFTRNSSINGLGTWTTVQVTLAGTSDDPFLFVLSDNTPGIAYRNPGATDERFARNTAVDGYGAWTNVLVDSGFGGGSSATVLLDKTPIIAYKGTASAAVSYANNTLPNGLGTWTFTRIGVSTGNNISRISIQLMEDGTPGIAGTDRAMCYFRTPQQSGQSGWVRNQLDIVGTFGSYMSIARNNPLTVYGINNTSQILRTAVSPFPTEFPVSTANLVSWLAK